MSGYTDGFVIPIPKGKIEEYRKMAEAANEVWLEHGVLDYKECIGEDLAANKDCGSFPDSLGIKEDEVVIFAWISYKSREHRDEVNAKVMKDPRIAGMCESGEMPFDPTRMLYGGFEVFVSKDPVQ
ncbi:DUF1428 domain-containing protein [Pelagicoccus sp. SDUM812002]|uniref:DUF1428 domain-containing protein n=1 Tax=Pelagicoccus sp. SDUM812002 TaxID=3041266 RepID=UPI0028106727|nr:DUF1428 domain-containing protein [Pelagicoccus sp. SDUM812002]MDQ8184014.1 DUF1428 domain-containing protein [Pelagicoccus sp. SDUM812002]